MSSRDLEVGRSSRTLAGASVALVASSVLVISFHGDSNAQSVPRVAAHAADTASANDAGRCEPCHATIVREWRGSMHRRSFTNEVFAHSYALESESTSPFCRDCHAPSNTGDEPTGTAADEGISCSVCHGDEVHVRGSGSGRTDGTIGSGGRAVHAVQIDPSIATSTFCATCHQFDFPLHPAGTHQAPMQNTFREWQATDAARRGVSCQGCHMPWVRVAGAGGHHRHDFPGIHDPSLMASAITVQVVATRANGRVDVTATVRPTGVGHGFPTGDLFRRVELRYWLELGNAPATTVALERTYAFVPGRDFDGSIASVRRPLLDTRLTPLGRTDHFSFPDSQASRAVAFSVEYLRMPDRQAAAQHIDRATNHIGMQSGSVPITTLDRH